jgi:hypothetical protein
LQALAFEGESDPMIRFIARIAVLERHPDGSSRQFSATRTVDEKTTVAELFEWRTRKVHDPVNGEFATAEIILTPDDSEG